MPDRFPFMLPALAVATDLVPGAKVNYQRLIEAIVIAVLTAGVTTYTTTKVLEVKISALEQRLVAAESLEKTNTQAMREEFMGLRHFVESHIARGSK